MKAMNHSERLRLIVEDGHLDHSPLAMGDVRSIADRIEELEAERRDWERWSMEPDEAAS